MKYVMIAAVIGCLMTASCTGVAGWSGEDSTQTAMADSSTHAAFARDESITAANAYSDLFLDSSSLENYLRNEKLAGSDAEALRNFYRVRNYQYAWFNSAGMTEQGRAWWSLQSEDSVNNKTAAGRRLDSLLQNDSLVIAPGDSSFVQTELGLSKNLVSYAGAGKHPYITRQNLYTLVPAKKQDALALADSLLHRQDSAQLGPNIVYNALKSQLARYYQAARDSQWTALPAAAANLKKGSSSPLASQLKKRLLATGDYAGDTSARFNDSLELAVREVQERYGLRATGKMNDSLLQLLNVAPQQRVEQLLVNMNRALWMQPPTDSQYLVVNIPSLSLQVVRDTQRLLDMPVVVGAEGTSTLLFSGEINQIVFSPVWHIPQSIIRNETMAKMKADPDYLKKNHMVIVGKNDSLPEINQLPGKDNAMGRVKFLFPNSYNIFLHDTPDKSIFSRKDRAISHGCIRVAEPEALAAYLLQDQKNWTPEKIRTAMNSDREQTVKVTKPLPVYLTYYTAWVDEKGRVNWRQDVYGHDAETASRLFLQPVSKPVNTQG